MNLVELLVVLAIVAVLSAFALPDMSGMLSERRARSELDDFAALLIASRTSAITLNAPVTFCPGTHTRCGTRNTWHHGTLAFVDFNLNREIDEEDVLIGKLGSIDYDVRWRSFRNRGYLRFEPSGFTAWQNGHFLLCPTATNQRKARQLVLNVSGRIYFSKDEDGDGVHEDVRGRPLNC